MSFQDVGKPGALKRPPKNKQALTPIGESVITPYNGNVGVGSGNESGTSVSNDGSRGGGYAQVSDGILQYQRNVGILDKIIRKMGTKADDSLLETQYNVQVDVIRQLGEKIEKQLQVQEINMQSLTRTEAARSRATHVKLTRDFRRVETTFKNMQLEARRKRQLVQAQKQEREEEDRKREEEGVDSEAMRVQMQIHEDRVNEEIMREREQEIRSINKGMHQVNEIYKDLAHIVGSQQEQVDQIEDQMEDANANAAAGLEQVQKANENASKSQCTIS